MYLGQQIYLTFLMSLIRRVHLHVTKSNDGYTDHIKYNNLYFHVKLLKTFQSVHVVDHGNMTYVYY